MGGAPRGKSTLDTPKPELRMALAPTRDLDSAAPQLLDRKSVV